jgi:moderate conductance mechanosensitive channel
VTLPLATASPARGSTLGPLGEWLRDAGLSDFTARSVEFVVLGPLRILGLLAGAFLLGRLGAAFLRRSLLKVRLVAPKRTRDARTEQRARTVADAIASLWKVIIWIVCALTVLGLLGVQLGPLVAGAGIAGIALAFGAQSLVKDYLSGLFILLEDQYSVGDVVTIGTASGTVEDVNLRVTRLRSVDGTVWFIPNGEIRNVGNQSMEWSRAVVDVTIGYENDSPNVMAALAEEIAAMYVDPAWSAVLLEAPAVQGVQSMGTEGVAIRVVAKTAPRQQWDVARELRSRITDRMRRDGVRGPGRTVMVSAGSLDSGPPPPAPTTTP